MRFLTFVFIFSLPFLSVAQRNPENVYARNIRTVQFNTFGNPFGNPIIALNGNDLLELNFDDMDGGVKYYYYTLELRNSDWSAVQMSYFDYVKGFTQQRINTYRNSTSPLSRFTHYQANIPDRNLMPSKSGNYVLKVFLNGDTSQLVFTKRLFVVDNKFSVAAQVQQPFALELTKSHHRIVTKVSTKGTDVLYPKQQVKINILQNNRWDNAITQLTPTFVKTDFLEFVNDQEMMFPAMREWRWLNLRSFRLLGDRVTKQENTDKGFFLFNKEESSRLNQPYYYYRDMDGKFISETVENVNPLWESDYAFVHFSYVPPSNFPFQQDVYVFGALSNYGLNPESKMVYNNEKKIYEADIRLKQGYYDYVYALYNPSSQRFSTDQTEGNLWETENNYQVLVYFRELGGRYDQLLGYSSISSLRR
jgi:hypothetical protein